jgi:hypothetical protein
MPPMICRFHAWNDPGAATRAFTVVPPGQPVRSTSNVLTPARADWMAAIVPA